MFHSFRPVMFAFAIMSILAGSIIASSADDYLKSAATEYRAKGYGAAYTLAGKSADISQRAFVRGMAAFRLDRYEEAAALLKEAEQKLPLIADYAAFYQAEALFKLKKYSAASVKAASIRKLFPGSRLLRHSEKLYADILYEAGDYKGAVKLYQWYVKKYPSSRDFVDANFKLSDCLEKLGDVSGAVQIYRNIWLNNPASSLASRAEERIKQLERSGLKYPPYTAEELLKRATTLYTHNRYGEVLKTLGMIPLTGRSQSISDRIDLRIGMSQYRMKQYKLAEKQFSKVVASLIPGVSSEARFWLARSLDRQGFKERALAMYQGLADEGKKQIFADDAALEVASIERSLRQYREASLSFEQAAGFAQDPKTVARSIWNAAWCRYLAGEYPSAAVLFKKLLGDETEREKVLYWLGKALENGADDTAGFYYSTLLKEFPAGFYATWYREQKGLKDTRETLGSRNVLAELPLTPGYDKPRLLSSLGMFEDARLEMIAIRKDIAEKKGRFPSRARVYLEMQDYSSAISVFMGNRPILWEKKTLPIWAVGYPRAYTELVSQNAAINGLSEGLVYAMIRAESRFSPAVKSSAGAIGLMQMMPATAKITAHEKGGFNPMRLTSPEYNIRLGTKHLNGLMKEYNGDVVYVAAAYNAGSGAVKRWKKSLSGLKKDEFIESIPYKETREYVKKVYASAATYRQLYGLK